MEKMNRLATAGILSAILGIISPPTPIRAKTRRRKMKGQGASIHYTKKGPGRRAPGRYRYDPASGTHRLRGHRRLPYAHGPDSINAKSIAMGKIDRLGRLGIGATVSDVRDAVEFVDAMRRHGHETKLLEVALGGILE